MTRQLRTQNRRIGQRRGTQESILRELATDVLYVLLFVLCVVLPFYLPDGYHDVGEHKFRLFRAASIGGLGLFALLYAADGAQKRRDKKTAENTKAPFLAALCAALRKDPTLILLVLWGAGLLLSFLAAIDKREALWGTFGWRMGFLTYVLMAALYLVYRFLFIHRRGLAGLVLAGPTLLCLVAILNRHGVYLDPSLHTREAFHFLATAGNINWLAGFQSIFLPLTLVWFAKAAPGKARRLAGAVAAIHVLCALNQGSDSIVLAMGMCLFLLYLDGLGSRERWLSFLRTLLLVGGCLTSLHLMLVWPGCLYNYHRDTLACTLGGLFCGELLLLAGTILLARARRGQGTAPFSKRTRLLLGVGVPALVATAAFLIVGRAFLAGFGADDWAGGRGVLYRATCQAFAELPLGRKLIGVGPDCYGALADNSPVMAAQLYPIFQELRMTNAHCEPLNRLVTTGIFDTLFFYGFLLACALRGFRVYRAAKTPAGLAVVLLAASYVTNSLVSFEQVLSTPYLFLTLGLLAGYLRGVQSVD